jgi:hypothetical protein
MPTPEIIAAVRNKYQALRPAMDEKVRRCWAACEAMAVGWGGISAVAEATGLSRPTLRAGIAEVQGGAPRAEESQPTKAQWNKIEYRLFCHIIENWRGKPLVSRVVMVNLIGNTKTRTGLTITAELDEHTYPTEIKVSAGELAAVRLHPDTFHGDGNYTLLPRA